MLQLQLEISLVVALQCACLEKWYGIRLPTRAVMVEERLFHAWEACRILSSAGQIMVSCWAEIMAGRWVLQRQLRVKQGHLESGRQDRLVRANYQLPRKWDTEITLCLL